MVQYIKIKDNKYVNVDTEEIVDLDKLKQKIDNLEFEIQQTKIRDEYEKSLIDEKLFMITLNPNKFVQLPDNKVYDVDKKTIINIDELNSLKLDTFDTDKNIVRFQIEIIEINNKIQEVLNGNNN